MTTSPCKQTTDSASDSQRDADYALTPPCALGLGLQMGHLATFECTAELKSVPVSTKYEAVVGMSRSEGQERAGVEQDVAKP